MTFIRNVINEEWLIKVQNGDIDNHSIVNKFGAASVGTTLAPISSNLNYMTPISPTGLTIVSDSVNDDYAGTGARVVQIQGLDENWVFQSEDLQMDGTTEVESTNQWYRIFRMKVISSGTYTTTTAPFSQYGIITLTDSASNDWGQILQLDETGGWGLGQSQIGLYTVASGQTAQLLNYHFTVDSNKMVDLYFFVRQDAHIVTAPYGAKQLKSVLYGVSGHIDVEGQTPLSKITGPADIGFMVMASAATQLSIDYQLLIHEHN